MSDERFKLIKSLQVNPVCRFRGHLLVRQMHLGRKITKTDSVMCGSFGCDATTKDFYVQVWICEICGKTEEEERPA